MNRKINSNNNLAGTHTRVFGNSSYNPQIQAKLQQHTGDDFLRQTQIVKIDSEILNKIG